MSIQKQQPSPPEHLRKPNDNHGAWLFRRIWDRVNQDNEHFMGVVVGREGSGKSHTAIKIASSIDPTFTPDRVMFDVIDLLELLKDGEHESGQFYVLDEAGVQLGKRTWQDREQVLANQALQLIRDHNLGLLFTLPRLGELDSQTQGRLQAFLELTDKESDEYVTGKWKWMDPDRSDETGKIYKKYPRRRENGVTKRIRRFSFTPPAPGLVEEYEATKDEFQTQFYKQVFNEMRDDEEQPAAGRKDLYKFAAQIANDGIADVIARNNQNGVPYINKDLIRADYDLSKSDARTVKAVLERQFDTDQLEDLA
jgi:hypothetical protein